MDSPPPVQEGWLFDYDVNDRTGNHITRLIVNICKESVAENVYPIKITWNVLLNEVVQ